MWGSMQSYGGGKANRSHVRSELARIGLERDLPASRAAAAGPKGRNAAAASDITLRAEILSYSRARGLFAGVSLE